MVQLHMIHQQNIIRAEGAISSSQNMLMARMKLPKLLKQKNE